MMVILMCTLVSKTEIQIQYNQLSKKLQNTVYVAQHIVYKGGQCTA